MLGEPNSILKGGKYWRIRFANGIIFATAKKDEGAKYLKIGRTTLLRKKYNQLTAQFNVVHIYSFIKPTMTNHRQLKTMAVEN